MRFVKKILSGALCAVLSCSAVTCIPFIVSDKGLTASAYTDNLFSGNMIQQRTRSDIEKYISEHPTSFSGNRYVDEPVYSGGTYNVGTLDPEYLQCALNRLNTYRYIAGLGEVTFKDAYTEQAQAAALVCAANNTLSHCPTQPEDMPDSLFKLGETGCSNCNLGMGYPSLIANVDGWVEDSNSVSNRSCLGHRRWCLYPRMVNTGFGQAGYYEAMFCMDNWWRKGYDEYKVVWPASVTPSDFFPYSSMWSVSKDTAFSSDTTVTLTRISDNRVWNFSSSSSDGLFYTNNVSYGQPACVIFRPEGITKNYGNEVFHVEVTDGSFQLEYNVNFYCDHTSTYKTEENKKAPTCTERGSYDIVEYCRKCGEVVSTETIYSEAKGHDWGDWTVSGNKEVRVCKNDPSHTEERDIPVSSVKLDKTSLTIPEGCSHIIKATVLPENATNKNVTWTSSDKSVATVSGGKITAKSAGSCTVTAKTSNGKTASCTVTVVEVKPLSNTSTVSSSSVMLGSSVTLRGSAAEGTAPYSFAYYYKLKTKASWNKLSEGFVSAASVSFKPGKAGEYDLKVTAKDSAGETADKTFSLTVSIPPLVNRTKISATTIYQGASVTISPTATGGTAPYTFTCYYKLTTKNSWNKFTGNTLKMGKTGAYDLRTVATDSTGAISEKKFIIKVKPSSAALTNTSTVSSSTINAGGQIKINASATGGTSPYTYAYFYKLSTKSSWNKITDGYVSAASKTLTLGKAGEYDIKVIAKDAAGSTAERQFRVTAS